MRGLTNKASAAHRQEAGALHSDCEPSWRGDRWGQRSVWKQLRRGNGKAAFAFCVRQRERRRRLALKRTARTTYQLLGLAEGVLHVGEAEAGHGDELAHHRHKLVSQLLRPLLLVVELLNTGERGEGLQRRRKEAGKVLRFVCGICVTHTFHTLQAAAQVVDVFFQLSHARKTAQFVKLNEKGGT